MFANLLTLVNTFQPWLTLKVLKNAYFVGGSVQTPSLWQSSDEGNPKALQ
jgi:hypothetical protein